MYFHVNASIQTRGQFRRCIPISIEYTDVSTHYIRFYHTHTHPHTQTSEPIKHSTLVTSRKFKRFALSLDWRNCALILVCMCIIFHLLCRLIRLACSPLRLFSTNLWNLKSISNRFRKREEYILVEIVPLENCAKNEVRK